MIYSAISKALAIALLASAWSSVCFADQDMGEQNALQDNAEASLISENQQRSLEMKMLSWQQSLADELQERVANTLLLKNNIEYHQDFTGFSADLVADRERIVNN